MNRLLIAAIICLLLTIGAWTGFVLVYRHDVIPAYDEKTCENVASGPVRKSCGSDNNCCGVWDMSTKACFRGELQKTGMGMECLHKPDARPIALGAAALLLTIATIVLFVMVWRHHSKKSSYSV